MNDFQGIKQLVRDFYKELDASSKEGVTAVLSKYVHDDYHWRGMYPFNELNGVDEVSSIFWYPLKHAIGPIQRRPDIFFAGTNNLKNHGGDWVCCMGHLMGLFDQSWLGIPPNRKMTFLRFVEFNEVRDGKIAQTAMFFDIPAIMKQVGIDPFPNETGKWFITPGPFTHDGLLYSRSDPEESKKTMDLINRMVDDLVGSDLESPLDELRETWHEDMIWFGPAGIGATYTVPRYQDQHQGPFSEGLRDIEFLGHIASFSEGKFGGFFGWPNLSMRSSGGFMGFPGSEKTAHMRVVDIYHRNGDRLAENWIFIDMLYFLHELGLDVLDRTKRIYG